MLDEAAKHLREGIALGRTDIIKTLLEEVKSTLEADPTEGSYKDFLSRVSGPSGTFLHDAVQQGKKDVVRALLLEGADPSIVDASGRTAVDLAPTDDLRQVFAAVLLQSIAEDNIVQVENLLKAGLDPNRTFDTAQTRNTPLIWACAFGSGATVRTLIEDWGADVCLANANGDSPLHEAIKRNAPDVADILLEHGADPDARASEGKWANKSCQEMVSEKNDASHADLKSVFEKWVKKKINQDASAFNGSLSDVDTKKNQDETEQCPLLDVNAHTLSLKGMSPIPALVTDDRLNLLWPQPAYVRQLSNADEGISRFPKKLSLSMSPGKLSIHRILDVWDTHKGFLSSVNRRVYLDENHPVLGEDFDDSSEVIKSHIWVAIEEKSTFVQSSGSYRLTVSNNRIRITASDLSGLHYAIMTLVQLFTLFHPIPDGEDKGVDERVLKIFAPAASGQKLGDEKSQTNDSVCQAICNNNGILSLHICDKPDLSIRAVLLDMNPYGRVPSLESLFQTIDEWAKLKINQFHAFIRVCKAPANDHVLCYSKSDFLTIDRYCRDRFIEFVPAIDVDSTLTSTSQIYEMQNSFAEILTCFDKPRFLHLGPKLTALMFSQTSVRFNIRRVLNISTSTTLMVCGNSLQSLNVSPERIMPNTVVIQYGFQKSESLTPALSKFSWSGLAVCVCTGTAAWSNLAGWTEAALTNGTYALKSLVKAKGVGSVTANWSSHPSFTHLVFSWPGFLIGAGLSWNTSIPESYIAANLPELLDIHVLGDMTYLQRLPPLEDNEADIFTPGRALIDLGHAENLLDERRRSKSSNLNPKLASTDTILLQLLIDPDDVDFDGLTIEDFGLSVQHIRRAQLRLMKCATPTSHRYEILRHEMQLTSELLLLSARIGRALRTSGSQPSSRVSPGRVSSTTDKTSKGLAVINVGIANLQSTFRTDIANKLLSLVEQYRALWLSRYQPQGLQGSLLILTNLLRKFIPPDK